MTEDLIEIKTQLVVLEALFITMSELLAPGQLEQIIRETIKRSAIKESRQAYKDILQRYYDPEATQQ